MGLFDNICVHRDWNLPGYPESAKRIFQTKGFNCSLGDYYIDSDGSIWKTSGDIKGESSFTGDLKFCGSTGSSGNNFKFYEYVARVKKGVVFKIDPLNIPKPSEKKPTEVKDNCTMCIHGVEMALGHYSCPYQLGYIGGPAKFTCGNFEKKTCMACRFITGGQGCRHGLGGGPQCYNDGHKYWEPKEPEKICETCRFDVPNGCYDTVGYCFQRDKFQPKEDKMETISYRDLVLAGAPDDAFRRWFNLYGMDDIPIDGAYDWLNIQADCYMRWVKDNPGKVPESWIKYIEEQEKPPPCESCANPDVSGYCYRKEENGCGYKSKWHLFREKPKRTVEEIINQSAINAFCVSPDDFLAAWPNEYQRDALALAANNFAKDREAMEEAVKQLKESCLDPIGAKALCILMDRLADHDKQAAEMRETK
jgi:hypothetical protein